MESAITDTAPAGLARRWDQLFPVLTEHEIARVYRFGAVRRYQPGMRLYMAGEAVPGMFVVLAGVVAISQRDGSGVVTPMARLERGQFSGEVALLSGRRSLTDAVADGDVEALFLPPSQLRALIIAEADLGERLVRALILRRVALLEWRASGPVIMGAPDSSRLLQLQNFLRRNDQPYRLAGEDDDSG